LDKIRILMGDEVSKRTKKTLLAGLENIKQKLDASIEKEKEQNDFLKGVPGILDALRSGKIVCRVYNKEKFHAKAYITHAKQAIVGSSALVGSSNFTVPGLTDNVELNVQLRREVEVLQEWFERHWEQAEEITPDILQVVERQTALYAPFYVYARALHEFFRRHEMTDYEWLGSILGTGDQARRDSKRRRGSLVNSLPTTVGPVPSGTEVDEYPRKAMRRDPAELWRAMAGSSG
jgi:phosphatidylserine/phosphatidylglycerophosphate/cardiolipin synthase-like enzyme